MSKNTKDQNIALVTGAAGFLGSNLCFKLLELGYIVYGVDNFITGQCSNVKDLEQEEGFTFFEHDINSAAFVAEFKDRPVTHIFNLACPTGVPNIEPMCEEMLDTCSTGMRHVLGLTRLHNAQLLHTSTAEVYGNVEVSPQPETYNGNVNPVGERSPYEEGKRFSESLVAAHTRKYDINARIARVFNVYGPRMSIEDRRVMPHFLKKMLAGESLIIYGDGSQTRTFVYVDDLVDGLIITMDKGLKGEVYNVGGKSQNSVKEVADAMIKISGKNHEIRYVPHFISDMTGRQPDITKVATLGWEPSTTLEEGLAKFMNSYESQTESPVSLKATV